MILAPRRFFQAGTVVTPMCWCNGKPTAAFHVHARLACTRHEWIQSQHNRAYLDSLGLACALWLQDKCAQTS